LRLGISVVDVEVEGPTTPCNLAAVPLYGSHAVSAVVAGPDAEVPLADQCVAVTRNDEVAGCPQLLEQDVDEPVGDDHLTATAAARSAPGLILRWLPRRLTP